MKRNLEDATSDEFGDISGSHDQPAQKKKRMSRFEGAATSDPTANGMPSSQNIQELLASTKKQIEERKKQTQALLAQQKLPTAGLLPTPSAPPMNVPSAAEHVMSSAMSEAVEKARKAAELQARINSSLMSKPGLLSSIGKVAAPPMPSKPMPLILDEEGRTVDSSGRTVQLSIKHSTAQVNIRAQQRAKFRQITEKKQSNEETEEETAFFDPRVTLTSAQRSKRQFKFNEAGKFVKQGQMLRAKVQLEQLQSEIASVARKTGISSATKLALIAPSKELFDDTIPIVEWWDAAILAHKHYGTRDVFGDKYRDISNLIEHPVPVQPPGEPAKSIAIPVILTSKERKKLRKQRRREAEKEKQEKIQFGLIEKPEPKVRISNLMRVLGSEAVQDPTKVEAHVRAQMAERQRKHEEANAARKLTPEQRKAKKLKKLREDLSCGVHVTVYRVHNLSNQAIKFKVDMNAQQYHLTGCVLLFHNVNLVIVEGGPKCLKKFKRLMMHRIKWNPHEKQAEDEDDDSDTETTRRKQNACYIVWEGKVHDRAFNDWKVRYFSTEGLARDHLKRHGVEHYWDLALSETIVEQEED